MSLRDRFAARVKEIRRRRGLTQAQLAERIGRSVNAISALERGVSLPNFETLERLADALGISVRDLFDVEGEGVSDPKRERLLAAINATSRSLRDNDLALAAAIIDLLAERRGSV